MEVGGKVGVEVGVEVGGKVGSNIRTLPGPGEAPSDLMHTLAWWMLLKFNNTAQ